MRVLIFLLQQQHEQFLLLLVPLRILLELGERAEEGIGGLGAAAGRAVVVLPCKSRCSQSAFSG